LVCDGGTRPRSARDQERVVPRRRFGQRRDAQTLAAVRGDRFGGARSHDTDLVSVRNLDRYMVKDLDRTEDIERLAAFDG
jgi:hypothetical protein